MRFGAVRICLLAAIVVLLVVVVNGSDEPSSTTVRGGTGTEPTFTYVDDSNFMLDWDPATSYSNEVVAMSNMYEQLVRYDARTRRVRPLLAESWRSSRDGRTWIFRLRAGVKFHTGRTLTAAAAKRALERTIRLDEGAAYEWAPVKSISAPDERTLSIELKYAAPLDLIASSAYGAYMYDTEAAGGRDLAEWFADGNSAGTGPYRVARWNRGHEIELRLKTFPSYWRGWEGPHYRQVVFRRVPEDTTASQLLQAGDATFVQRLRPQLFDALRSSAGIATAERPSFQNLIAFFNTEAGPLKDERVRHAIVAAMDYDGLISVLKGSAVPASGVIPEGLLGHDPGLRQRQSLSEAQRLLQAVGYGDGGKRMQLLLTHTEGDEDQALAAAILKSKLAELNVDVQVRALQWETQWDRAKSRDPSKQQDIFVMYWYPDYPDPFSWFTNLFKSSREPYFNLSYYENPALDGQIDRLQELTAIDTPAAEATYRRAQRIVIDDAAVMVLYVQKYRRLFRDTMRNYVDNPAYANVVFVYDVKPAR